MDVKKLVSETEAGVFRENMHLFLSAKKVSQSKLASDIGVHRNIVNNWVLGKSRPRFDHVAALSARYGIDFLKKMTIDDLQEKEPSATFWDNRVVLAEIHLLKVRLERLENLFFDQKKRV